MHMHQFKQTCNNFLVRFFITISKHLNIYWDRTRRCEEWSHITNAFAQCTSVSDVEKFLLLMYISFDFIDNCRDKIAAAVLRQLGMRVLKDEVVQRKKINCFQKIVTKCINEKRKSLNRMGIKTCGWSLTSTRPGYLLDSDEINENEYRKPQHIYGWMIMGQRVCIFLLFYQLSFIYLYSNCWITSFLLLFSCYIWAM
jgi:hypothetical protein